MAEKLDWIKRFFATLFGFIIFGVVGIIFKIIFYVEVKNYQHNDLATQLKCRKRVSKTWRIFVRYLTYSGILEVKFNGFERLGREGQLILANHPSLLDVVLIFSQEPRLNCIVKSDLLNNPAMKSPILACGFLPNSESIELLEQTDHILKNGQCLLIFPEGTRTGWDGVVKLHRSAVSIGLRSAKIITPIVIKMTPFNFKKNQPWYKIPAKRIKYELTVGEDIDPKILLTEKPLPIVARKLNKHLENYFNLHTKDL